MRILLVWLFFWVVSMGTGAHAAESLSPTPAMADAIQRVAPGARIVAKGDVSTADCGDEFPDQPGLVMADFQGGGRRDFAVLLNAGDSGKVTEWEGKKLKLFNYAFAIFLDDGNGAFKLKLVERFEEHLPLAMFIHLEEPGKLDDRDSGNGVTLEHPGVTRVYCDKSAVLYHLVGEKIKTVQLSD